MADYSRNSRQPIHGRKGVGDSQPTPLNRLKAGQSNDKPLGKDDQKTTAKNKADSNQNRGSIHKIGTPYHI